MIVAYFVPRLYVRGSMHYTTIHKEKPNKMQQYIEILLFHTYMKLYMFPGDTPPIIRSPKLHWQALVFHTWKVVGRVVGGRCQVQHVKYLEADCIGRSSSVMNISTESCV